MAKVDDDLKPPGWDEPPLPLYARKSPERRARSRQLSLRHIMIATVYFALIFWAAKGFIQTNGYANRILLGVLVGLGFCSVGILAAFRLARYSFMGWILFIVGFMATTSATTGFYSIWILPIVIGAIIYVNLRRRANNQDALLWVLTVAAERGVPLQIGVQAFADQASGIYEVWSESLAELLRRGASLSDSLESLPRLLSAGSSFLIRMGEEAGSLPAGLREVVNSRTRHVPILQSIGARIAYLGWIVAIGQSIVGFVMYFIIPKFEAIFKDFGVLLPETTIMVIRASHAFVDYAFIPILVESFLLIYLVMLVAGWGSNSVPIFDRLFGRRHSILIMRGLAVFIEARRPIEQALRVMGEWYPTGWVRKKLARASIDAEHGSDWVDVLREEGLLKSSDVGVVTSAQRAGNLAWALRELSETIERRWSYRLQAWTHILFALAMLVLGALVFLIAVAYFAPLTTLISRLAQ